MSSRRSLLSRQHRGTEPPQVQRPRQNNDAGSSAGQSRQLTALPPYEPPSCPLTDRASRSLANIAMSRDYKNLEKHLNAAIQNITTFAGESNDRLYQSKERVRRMAQSRENAQDDSEKTEVEERAEQRAREMEEKVERLTRESEKALRDLIDYKQELAQQGELLQSVIKESVTSSSAAATAAAVAAAAAAASRDSRRRREMLDNSEDLDDDFNPPAEGEDIEMGGPISHADILSPTELLRKAKEEYQTTYTSKTMRER